MNPMRKFTALIILGLILSSSVSGQVPNFSKIPNKEGNEQPLPSKAPSGIHELTAQDLETFLDGIVPLQLEREDIAGATVTAVKDGKLLFAKGYGYADYEKQRCGKCSLTVISPTHLHPHQRWAARRKMPLGSTGYFDRSRAASGDGPVSTAAMKGSA